MKRYLRLATLATIVGVAAVAVTACGHHRHDTPQEKAEWVIKKATRKLDLNADQQAKLKDVTDIFVQQHNERKTQRHQHFESVLTQITSPELDKAAIQSMFDEHQQHMAALAPAVIDKVAVFHASLNNEQKQELAEKLEKMKKYHHDDD